MPGMTEAFFGALAHPFMPWLLSLLIVVAASSAWLTFRFGRIAPVLDGLDRAIKLIEESEGASGFRRRFQAIYKGMAENPIVGEVWRAYASTIAPAPGSDDALGYSRRPEENFNEGLLAVAGVNLRFYHAVPNLLVGCGLLFTFLGLIAALYFASRGIAAAGIDQAQQALRELLAAATFKFVTSVAGLGSSLIFSWGEKAVLYRVQRRLARLCAALEERMVPVTSESLAMNQLGELKAQHAELRRMSRNLILRVPEEIESRLAEELTTAIVPLRHAIGDAAARLAHLDEHILEVLAAGLPAPGEPLGPTPPVGRGAGRLQERLGKALQEAAAKLAAASPGVEAAAPLSTPAASAHRSVGILRRFDERLGEVLLRLRQGVEALARYRGRDGSRPADLLRRMMQTQAELEGARQMAQELRRELDLLLEGGQADATTSEPVEAALERLGSRIAGDMAGIDARVTAAGTQIAQAVRLLQDGERR